MLTPASLWDLIVSSMWNLIISTIVFFVAAWYIHRYLNKKGMRKSWMRALLVFVLASLLSWGAGDAVDWVQEKIEGPQAAAHPRPDLSQLLKSIGQPQR
jgi:predicted PurR-regulated permease PerM